MLLFYDRASGHIRRTGPLTCALDPVPMTVHSLMFAAFDATDPHVQRRDPVPLMTPYYMAQVERDAALSR